MSEQQSQDVANLTICQECGQENPNLAAVDTGMRLILQKAGREDIPTRACPACLKNFRRSASHGAQELAKKQLQADFAGKLWGSRVGLVKQGHLCLQRGEYPDAAVLYEKYLKILTLVVKVKSKEALEPKHFNDHPKEITIISSVLWDLMLIYDANTKFTGKQLETAQLLSRFLRFSPVYNSIIRRAEKEARRARNPQAFRHLLKLCDAHTQRCFIANETFGSRVDPTVVSLCLFRDQVLKEHPVGRKGVAYYYKTSPRAADWIRKHPWLKSLLRPLLRGVAKLLHRIFRLPPSSLS